MKQLKKPKCDKIKSKCDKDPLQLDFAGPLTEEDSMTADDFFLNPVMLKSNGNDEFYDENLLVNSSDEDGAW